MKSKVDTRNLFHSKFPSNWALKNSSYAKLELLSESRMCVILHGNSELSLAHFQEMSIWILCAWNIVCCKYSSVICFATNFKPIIVSKGLWMSTKQFKFWSDSKKIGVWSEFKQFEIALANLFAFDKIYKTWVGKIYVHYETTRSCTRTCFQCFMDVWFVISFRAPSISDWAMISYILYLCV